MQIFCIFVTEIATCDDAHQIMEIDGMEKFAFTVSTKKKDFRGLTWLAASFEEQDEWAAAISSFLHTAHTGHSSPDGSNSPNHSTAPVDKQGWLDLSGTNGNWALKYVSISALGLSWDDGESADESASTTATDIRLKLVAESAEAFGAWLVALKWLEGGCCGPAPRDDPHMCVPKGLVAAPEVSCCYSLLSLLSLPISHV